MFWKKKNTEGKSFSLFRLIGKDKLRDLIVNFHVMLELPVAIYDKADDEFIYSSDQRICRSLVRTDSSLAGQCVFNKSVFGALELYRDRLTVYACRCSLLHGILPVIIERRVIALIIIGPYRKTISAITESTCLQDVNQEVLNSVLFQAPVFSEEKIKQISDLTRAFIKVIVTQGITMVSLQNEIERRQKVELDLIANGKEMISIIENLPNPVFYKNADGFYLGCNNAFCEFTGLSKHNVLGKTVFDLFPLEFAREYADNDRKLLESSDYSIIHESTMPDVNDIVKDVIIYKSRFQLNGAQVVIGVVTDISEQKKAMEREKRYFRNTEFLYHSAIRLVDFSSDSDIFKFVAERLKILIPKSFIVVCETDFEKNNAIIRATNGFESYNSILVKLLGFNFIGRNYPVNEKYLLLLDGNVHKVEDGVFELTNGIVSVSVSAMIEKLLNIGSIHAVGLVSEMKLLASVLILLPKGVELQNIHTIRLFVQQVALALKKRKAEEEKNLAYESNRMKSMFLANMSHEIRTPLNGILGFCQLLKKGDLSSVDQEQLLDLIDKNSHELLNVINDIIDISRIEAGQINIKERDFNMNQLIREVTGLIKVQQPRYGKEHLELRNTFPLADDAAGLWADDLRLKQILINLMNNALKFTENGFIEIGYSIHTGNMIRFYVKDTGIGIPHTMLQSVFNRFQQVDESVTRKHGGTGLGLSISKEIARLMGGELWVESVLHEGSVFYLSLPYITNVSINENSGGDAFAKKFVWHGKRILLVEDHYRDYVYLKMAIEQTHADLLRVENGNDAVVRCRDYDDIDVVLMDIQLPDIDGFDATRKILADKPDMPVIALTAMAMEEDRNKALAAGCMAYLAKPYHYNELFAIIDQYLKQ